MSQPYKVQIIQEENELRVKIRNIDCFFLITGSKDVLDAQGNVQTPVFTEILSTTFRDLAPEISRDKKNREFEVISVFNPALAADMVEADLSRKTSSLLETLSREGMLHNHSAIMAQVYLENQSTGHVYHMLAGFTIRSNKKTIYLLDSSNCVRPL